MKCILPVVVIGLTAGPAMAATGTAFVNGANTVAGTVANTFVVDGQGDDWTGAVLKIDLNNGSVYNEPGFGSTGGPGDGNQSALWGFVPGLEFDSYVGISGDGTAGIAGGAGDLGGGLLNIGGTGVDAVSVTWFNTDTGNTGLTEIGNITLTDDANGTVSLILSFANSQIRLDGVAENGLIFPEPASLALMSLCGFVVLRRRR